MKFHDYIYVAERWIKQNKFAPAITCLTSAEQIADHPHQMQLIDALKQTIERKRNDIEHKRKLFIQVYKT